MENKKDLKILSMTLILGFASGLPLALSSGTLQAWLTIEGVDLKTLGWLSLVGLPYTYKFVWAPVIDRYRLPFNLAGRRRGWMVFFLLGMAFLLLLISQTNPKEEFGILHIAALALLLAFFSASFDVVFDAWRAESLSKRLLGLGAAWSVIGYRVAMLTSGGLALMLADFYLGFDGVYKLLALICLVLSILAFFSPEPKKTNTPPTLMKAVVEPFKEFFSRNGAVTVLITIIMYKFGDAFTASLSTAFLIRGAGFSPAEVGAVSKGAGLIAILIGGLLGGLILTKFSLLKCLLFFGILQAITNLGFLWLASYEANITSMAIVIILENLAGGMGTAAFVALLM
ncbi:MAG: muropeptide transporter AmpG, partial [Betaproteobacteria bacterium TMED156]